MLGNKLRESVVAAVAMLWPHHMSTYNLTHMMLYELKFEAAQTATPYPRNTPTSWGDVSQIGVTSRSFGESQESNAALHTGRICPHRYPGQLPDNTSHIPYPESGIGN